MTDPAPSTAPSVDDALAQELRAAVSAGDFELHYQPKVRCPDGGFEGFEALVRWRHPTAWCRRASSSHGSASSA
jgi:EAL domain-containing protein (putative c-di-GMP-specific phosphodiesterase class I)